MGFQKRALVLLSAGLGSLVFIVLALAWFQIQAVRLGYKAQSLRRQIDDMAKGEQGLDRRLQEALSLSRLDHLAKSQFHLQVPQPSQIILLVEEPL